MENNKEYIKKILASGDDHKHHEMLEYIECLLKKIEDEEEKECMERWLYEISEGRILNEMKADKLISKMKPFGKKWELTDTENIRLNSGPGYEDIRPVDFWIVMNSAYNDYNDIFNDTVDYYARFSKDFIKDPDSVEDKVYYYFTMIPKEK